jgi:hypothetical protein
MVAPAVSYTNGKLVIETPAVEAVEDDLFVEAAESDLQRALANALRRAGCTYEELAQQARDGEFSSSAAQRAWVVVRSLVS